MCSHTYLSARPAVVELGKCRTWIVFSSLRHSTVVPLLEVQLLAKLQQSERFKDSPFGIAIG